jgi:hypothetical protein
LAEKTQQILINLFSEKYEFLFPIIRNRNTNFISHKETDDIKQQNISVNNILKMNNKLSHTKSFLIHCIK